jgi:hypothetical protein
MGADRKMPIDTQPMIMDMIVSKVEGSSLKTYKGNK